MSTLIGIGFSQNPSPEQAFKEAAIDVKSQMNIPAVDLAMIFFTSGYAQPKAIDPVNRILQPAQLIGSMTPAIILHDRIESRGVAILGISSDEIKVGTAMFDHLSLANMREAGLRVAREAVTHATASQRHGFLALMNSVNANHTPFLFGLQEALGRAFTFCGGFSCDEKLGRGALFHKETLSSDGILGMIFSGSAQLAVSARHGLKPLGKPRIIDEAEGNLIRLIDHKPAISLYQNYFADEMKALEPNTLGSIGMLYPLGLNTDRPKEYLLRHPVEVLPDGAIVCQAEVTAGSRVHLMIGDKDSCRQAAHDAATDVRDQLFGKPPRMLLVFESIARRKLLGRAITQELALIKDILGLTVPIFGMYTYGEIAPLGSFKENRISEVHNASIVIAAIG